LYYKWIAILLNTSNTMNCLEYKAPHIFCAKPDSNKIQKGISFISNFNEYKLSVVPEEQLKATRRKTYKYFI
jgi:hypothetical protein